LQSLLQIEEMTRKVHNNNNILVPIDFSEISFSALEHAKTMAVKYNNEITLLHIEDDTAKSESRLIELAGNIKNELNVNVHTLLKSGKVSDMIAQVAEVGNYDSIVMGSGGSSGMQLFMGSNASKVIRSIKIPVIVVKTGQTFDGYDKIVMPVDLSVESKQKVGWAKHLAKKYDSTIHVIYEEEDDEYFQKNIKANINQVSDILTEAGVKHELFKLEDDTFPGKLYKDTLQYAEQIDADLILVMTQLEGSFMDFVIGSHAQLIVNRAKCAVMVVQPSETGFSFDYL